VRKLVGSVRSDASRIALHVQLCPAVWFNHLFDGTEVERKELGLFLRERCVFSGFRICIIQVWSELGPRTSVSRVGGNYRPRPNVATRD
jgi:hypothetical protein